MGLVGFADPSSGKDVKSFGVGSHKAIFDTVVDHLDEVPRSTRPAVQPAFLGRNDVTRTTRSPLGGAHARSEYVEQGSHSIDGLGVAANHHAVAALQAENTA